MIEERDELMRRLWAAEDSATPPAKLRAQALEVASGLERILAARPPRADPGETARTWRYLGDACFLAAEKKHQRELERGRAAYLRAEALLADRPDPLAKAKLDFNLANTLRALGEPPRFPHLEEAARRYAAARAVAQELQPELVPRIESALESLELLRGLVDVHARSGVHAARVEAMMQRLRAAGHQADRPLLQELERELQSLPSLADAVRQARGQARGVLRALAAGGGPRPPGQLEHALEPLALAAGQREQEADMGAMFDLLRVLIGQRATRGEINPLRQAALTGLVAEFQTVTAMPDGTALELAVKLDRQREIIARFKAMVVDVGGAAAE